MTGKRILLSATLTAWVGSLALGFWALWRHSGTAGEGADPPESWPEGSGVPRSPAADTLLFFAHPRCPCTGASLNELARVLSAGSFPVQVWVLIVKPKAAGAGWEEGPNWAAARSMERVRVLVDEGGREARRFRAHTSGQVLYYDRQGRLRFRGGITAARGHQGESTGGVSLLEILEGREPVAGETPVYGCALLGTE